MASREHLGHAADFKKHFVIQYPVTVGNRINKRES